MKLNGKQVLICDCEGTIDLPQKALEKLFGSDDITVNTHLYRAQIANFKSANTESQPSSA